MGNLVFEARRNEKMKYEVSYL